MSTVLTPELLSAVSSGKMGVLAAYNRATGRTKDPEPKRKPKDGNVTSAPAIVQSTTRAGRKTGRSRGRPKDSGLLLKIVAEWQLLCATPELTDAERERKDKLTAALNCTRRGSQFLRDDPSEIVRRIDPVYRRKHGIRARTGVRVKHEKLPDHVTRARLDRVAFPDIRAPFDDTNRVSVCLGQSYNSNGKRRTGLINQQAYYGAKRAMPESVDTIRPYLGEKRALSWSDSPSYGGAIGAHYGVSYTDGVFPAVVWTTDDESAEVVVTRNALTFPSDCDYSQPATFRPAYVFLPDPCVIGNPNVSPEPPLPRGFRDRFADTLQTVGEAELTSPVTLLGRVTRGLLTAQQARALNPHGFQRCVKMILKCVADGCLTDSDAMALVN